MLSRQGPTKRPGAGAPRPDGRGGHGGDVRGSQGALRAGGRGGDAGRVFNVRPGLISGPHDPTDRFTYWPRRIAAGGEVLAPDRPERGVQFIDVRDLAAWIIEMAAERGPEPSTPPAPTTSWRWADCSKRARPSAVTAELIWVSEDFLEEHGVEPFTELPLWVPREDAALLDIDCGRAIEKDSLSDPCPRRSRTCWSGTARGRWVRSRQRA